MSGFGAYSSPFDVLAMAATRLAESDDSNFGDAIEAVLQLASDSLSVDAVAVCSFVEETRQIVPIGYASKSVEEFISPRWSDVPVLLVKLNRFQPAIVSDISYLGTEWAAEHRWLERMHAKSFCAYPIVIEQKCAGTLLTMKRSTYEWPDESVVLARAIGELTLMASRRFYAERRLKRLQGRTLSLVENLPVNVLLTDADASVSWVNQQARTSFGVVDIPCALEQLCHPDDVENALVELKDAIDTRRAFAFEARLGTTATEFRWMSLRGEPRREDGEFVGHVVAAVDITDRLRSAEAVAERARFSQAILELSRKFVDLDADELGDAIDEALQTVGNYLQLDRAVLGFLDRSPEASLEFRYAGDWSPDGLPDADGSDRLSVAEIPHIFAELRGLRAVSVDSISELPQGWGEERRSAQRRGTRSMLWVPVAVRGRLGGALWLSVTHEERSWSDSLATIRILADMFGGALERLRSDDELFQAAYNDRLTGALNRAGTMDEMRTALAEDGPLNLTTAIMFLDLDGFKGVNDTYGHDAGDEVLVQVADRLRALIRPSDALGRLGGDEFVLLCRNIDQADTAIAIGSRVVASIAEELQLTDVTVRIGVSVGIALIKGEHWTVDEAVRVADEAMYKAKKSGKGQVCVSDRRDLPAD